MEVDIAQVRSVARALDILNALGESQGGVGVIELAEHIRLNASTTHRLLSTLLEYSFVRQDADNKKYLLGSQSLRLGYTALSHFDIRNDSLDLLRELSESVQELTNLALLTGDEVMYVAQVPASRPVQMFTQLGSRLPLYCTGVGKAILAHLSDDEAHAKLNIELLAYTEHTIVDRATMKAELVTIRQRGYAVDNEEREVGVRCIAAPIFRADGTVMGAVSVSGPSVRISTDRVEEYSRHVLTIASSISKRIGFSGASRPLSRENGR